MSPSKKKAAQVSQPESKGIEEFPSETLDVKSEIPEDILDKPKIICLCGSTRFVDTFNEWRKRATLEGKIVLSIEIVLPQTKREDPQHNDYKVKRMLDELHLRKIDLADEVMILNVNGYIGESTRNELDYAISKGKKIIFLEPFMKPISEEIK